MNVLARGVALWVCIAFLGTALYLHFLNVRFASLTQPEAIDSAQIALNYLKTGHLTTRVIYPLALSLPRPDIEGYDIYRAPLYSLALATLMRTRMAEDATVAMANGLFHLLTAWVLFGIIRTAYDRRTAIWAALAFIVSTDVITIPLEAQGPALTGLLFSLAILLALRAASLAPAEGGGRGRLLQRVLRSPWTWIAAASVVSGLTWLSGNAAVLMLVPIGALAVTQCPNRRLALLVMGGVVMLTVSPWLARNYMLLHHFVSPLSQYELVMHTPKFLSRSILWMATERPDNPAIWAVTHPGQMIFKAVEGMTVAYGCLPTRTSPYLFAFALVGLLAPQKTSLQSQLWRTVALALVLQALTMSLYDIGDGPMSVFSALLTGLGVAAAVQLVRERLKTATARGWAGSVLAGLLVFGYVSSVWLGQKAAEDESLRSIAFLATNLPGKSVVASDLAWQVAWYAERRAVLLPADAVQLAAIGGYGYIPDYLYLSRQLRGPRIELGRGYWYGVMNRLVDPTPLGVPSWLPNGELVIATPHSRTLLRPGSAPAAPGTGRSTGPPRR